jgi:hypothetical protein
MTSAYDSILHCLPLQHVSLHAFKIRTHFYKGFLCFTFLSFQTFHHLIPRSIVPVDDTDTMNLRIDYPLSQSFLQVSMLANPSFQMLQTLSSINNFIRGLFNNVSIAQTKY